MKKLLVLSVIFIKIEKDIYLKGNYFILTYNLLKHENKLKINCGINQYSAKQFAYIRKKPIL